MVLPNKHGQGQFCAPPASAFRVSSLEFKENGVQTAVGMK